MGALQRNGIRIVIWAVTLGLLTGLIADWGEWDRFPINLLWRVLIGIGGGIVGLIMNVFTSHYISMGTNVIESMGITKFSNDTQQKIENSFAFVGVFTAAAISMIFLT
ncbi:MAG: hypothetical protein ABIQ44_07640 [Chloroflexia bacterium]